MTCRQTTSLTPRILLVDDHPLVRSGVRACLEASCNVEVTGEASNIAEALRAIEQEAPDIMITDIRMPPDSGMELVSTVAQMNPSIKILVLTMLGNVALVSQAINLGASGYLLKDSPAVELEHAIDAVLKGETYFAQRLLPMLQESNPIPRSRKPLTPKETAVLKLLAQGQSSKQIADTLGMSVRTVETHRLHLRRKLKLEGQAPLTHYAADLSDLILHSTPGH